MGRSTAVTALGLLLAALTLRTAHAEEPKSTAVLGEALGAFPKVPTSIEEGCESSLERGTFKLLRCQNLLGTYSYDATNVVNYMQVMRVPDVKDENACKALFVKLVPAAVATGSWKDPSDSKAHGHWVHHYFAQGTRSFVVKWADSRATGKMCGITACNVEAGPNIFGLDMCRKN